MQDITDRARNVFHAPLVLTLRLPTLCPAVLALWADSLALRLSNAVLASQAFILIALVLPCAVHAPKEDIAR